jgi:hypothetical protein
MRIKALAFMVPFVVLPFFLFAEKDPKAGPITLFLTVPFGLLLVTLFARERLTDWLITLVKRKPAVLLAAAMVEMAVIITAVVWLFLVR